MANKKNKLRKNASRFIADPKGWFIGMGLITAFYLMIFIILVVVVLMSGYYLSENKGEGVTSVGSPQIDKNINRDLPAFDDGSMFYYPVERNYISSFFGRRNPPKRGASSQHGGIDIAPGGIYTKIYPSRPGEVVKVELCKVQPKDFNDNKTCKSPARGNNVIIKHELAGGVIRYTRYVHLFEVMVKEGDLLGMGDVVGSIGNTGTSTGAHLHFEIKTDLVDGTINPIPLLYCGDKDMSGNNFSPKQARRNVEECFLYRQ